MNGMLDSNRNSGENIGPDIDPYVFMQYDAQDPRPQIWRKVETTDGTVVQPTGPEC